VFRQETGMTLTAYRRQTRGTFTADPTATSINLGITASSDTGSICLESLPLQTQGMTRQSGDVR
jgi:hypothetical protein